MGEFCNMIKLYCKGYDLFVQSMLYTLIYTVIRDLSLFSDQIRLSDFKIKF